MTPPNGNLSRSGRPNQSDDNEGEDEMDIFVLFLPVFWFVPPDPI
jgi:hypothetical protein